MAQKEIYTAICRPERLRPPRGLLMFQGGNVWLGSHFNFSSQKPPFVQQFAPPKIANIFDCICDCLFTVIKVQAYLLLKQL